MAVVATDMSLPVAHATSKSASPPRAAVETSMSEDYFLPGCSTSVLPHEVSRASTMEARRNLGHSHAGERAITETNLQEIRRLLDNGEGPEKILSMKFSFFYKKRRCQGRALHAAVVHETGYDLVLKLLRMKADVHEECSYTSFDIVATAAPMHLVVQSGRVDIMQALLNARASLDARARRGDKLHFCPLHEAAFFQEADLARFLLEKRANANTQNLEGMTPLHVAAKMGAVEVADVLTRYSANSDMKDFSDRTALKVAVESGVFPHRRLHLLARWCLRDIMIVAEHCPSSAAEFMKDLNGHGQASNVAVLQQDEALTVEHWLHLMTEAPEAGVYFLEVITVEPDEDSIFYHPLPTQACVKNLRCEYQLDETWKCNTEASEDSTRKWPEWHDRLAPGGAVAKKSRRRGAASVPEGIFRRLTKGMLGSQLTKELVPVHIRQLKLPGMIDARVLQALSETSYLEVFRSEATQTILQFTWESFAKRYFGVQFIHRVLELCVLLSWTIFPPVKAWDESEWRRRCSCSFIWVSAFRETLAELWQAYGFVTDLQAPESYFGNPWNYIDWVSIMLFDVFATNALVYGSDLGRNLPIFSCVVLARWVQMLYSMRGFGLGSVGIRGVIPILHSMKEIGGMLIICLFTFAGFAHAFVVLDNGVSEQWTTLILTARLLFLGDGDGIDAILDLGGRGGADGAGDLVTACFFSTVVFLFCISLLNLFIAVHGEAYSGARRMAMGLHLQERASICLQCVMQPQWPPTWLHWLDHKGRIRGVASSSWLGPMGKFALLAAAVVPIWASLMLVGPLNPIFPSILLLGADVLGLCFLTERPWDSEKTRASSFLWWCAPVHKGQGWWPEEEAKGIEQLADRLTYLEHNLEMLVSAFTDSASQQGHMPARKSGIASDKIRTPILSPEARRAQLVGRGPTPSF